MNDRKMLAHGGTFLYCATVCDRDAFLTRTFIDARKTLAIRHGTVPIIVIPAVPRRIQHAFLAIGCSYSSKMPPPPAVTWPVDRLASSLLRLATQTRTRRLEHRRRAKKQLPENRSVPRHGLRRSPHRVSDASLAARWGLSLQSISISNFSSGSGVQVMVTRHVDLDFEGMARFNRIPTSMGPNFPLYVGAFFWRAMVWF
jgi:hypothetical protein